MQFRSDFFNTLSQKEKFWLSDSWGREIFRMAVNDQV